VNLDGTLRDERSHIQRKESQMEARPHIQTNIGTPQSDYKRLKGNVCIVRHNFYPSELSVRREAEALRDYGYNVHVICLRNKSEATREVVAGVHVRRLPVVHRRGKIGRYLLEYNFFFVLASIDLLWLHFRLGLQAVQVNNMPDYLIFCSLLLRLSGVKTVLHMHEPMPELFRTVFENPRYRPLIKIIVALERLSLGYADRVLTVTQDMREIFARRGADINKITVVLNVPNERLFSPERITAKAVSINTKGTTCGSRAFRLFSHGTIEYRYGVDLIINALARIKDAIPGLEFRFTGQGDYVPTVLTRATELGVTSQVKYLGYVPFETMLEEILCADLTIVPLRRNPWSVLVHTNKMYEYMALGRPVIASRLESVARYFPADTLLYFEPDDDVDLAKQVLYAFNHPEEMQGRVDRANQLYRSYSWTYEKQKYLGMYETLLCRRLSTGSLNM
jgi:glycosyltransferase involved in cell wall biosynthesis